MGRRAIYLDGDKVGLAFIGNGLGKHSFTSTGRTVEQNTLGGTHTKLEELFGMFDRVLYSFLEFLLDLVETTNIVPGDSGDFNNSFTECRWVRDA